MARTDEDRIRDLLDDVKDLKERLSAAEEAREEAEDKAGSEDTYRRHGEEWGWSRFMEVEESDRPVPRLEMRWRDLDERGYSRVATYGLVRRHYSDDRLCFVPFGATKQSGGPTPAVRLLDTPFRDGTHMLADMAMLGLRGFVVDERTGAWREETFPADESMPPALRDLRAKARGDA